MKKNTLFIILIFLLIIIFIYFRVNKSKPKIEMQPNKNQVANVTAFIVKPQKLQNKIYTTGTVTANQEVELRNEIAGKVIKIFFKEGSRVSKGEMLVKIYDNDLQSQLKKLNLQKELAETNEGRQKQLLNISGISQADYDITLNQVNSAKADIDIIKAQIEKTEIKAPFNGIIGLKAVSEGAYLQLNTKIATVQEIDPLKIDFSIPEKYMSSVKTNDEINFTVQGVSGNFKGKIFAIEPKIDPATRTILLRAICQNKENKIFPGAFARIELSLAEIENALLIPTQALIPELKGQKIFLSRDGKAFPQKVETGIRNDSAVQIVNGIKSGDTVITTGIMQLKPNGEVKMIAIEN